ncbi:MAG TPA: OmpA family protein [Flavobacteriaceae bacterium]|nr:OmpA family protein [Flavobacteriaceae bacterium]
MKKIYCILLFCLGFCSIAIGQENPFSKYGEFYRDFQNNIIYMPLGKISFADSVVAFSKGLPAPTKKFGDPKKALGEPDYQRYLSPDYVSLGCGGILVVEFRDNGFVDLPGDDLYFYEVGPSVEPFIVEISTDGKKWKDVGKTRGGSSSMDITAADRGLHQIYYYVRLTDLQTFCPGETPGSDIDAVGTVSGVFKISLNTDVLFDTDKYTLKQEPLHILEELATKIERIGNSEILIEGHTDSDGSIPYNITLSENRAFSVADKLHELLQGKGEFTYSIKAYGEAKPRATNNTDAGKQLNRRVEIIVLPDLEFYKVPERPSDQ